MAKGSMAVPSAVHTGELFVPGVCCIPCVEAKHCEAPCAVSQSQDGTDKRADTKNNTHGGVHYMFLIAHASSKLSSISSLRPRRVTENILLTGRALLPGYRSHFFFLTPGIKRSQFF